MPTYYISVRFEVVMAVTMRNGAFWDAACVGLLVTANVVPSSPILVTLMMEALSSSETSVLTRVKHPRRRNSSYYITFIISCAKEVFILLFILNIN
jgi:hypothetical protein